MSTSSKGDHFEKLVFKYLETELARDDLFVQKKLSQIFQKKAYFSKDRGSHIITDISIETSLPNSTTYSLLTVVECKDYSGNIPVDAIEEFHAKVQQISGNNSKAIFATTSALQKAALAYARSKNIAVIRFLPDYQVQWMVYHKTFNETPTQKTSEFEQAFLDQHYISTNRSYYGCVGDQNYDNLFTLLRSLFNVK
jgi:hypothetical protein